MLTAAMLAALVDYVGSNWDVPGFYSALRSNTAGQDFQRRLSAIDYRIQKQELHRDDLRDLMELTTGRMDIYMVVGTLLLTFCITWFTDNGVLTASLPDWFIMMFLINNFNACGYLMLSVWLAMHTSVSAHTIGVRLLTSYARLSIPSKEELDNIREDVLPSLNKFLAHGSDMIEKAVAKMFDGKKPEAPPLERQRPARSPTPEAGPEAAIKVPFHRALTIISHDEETAVPTNPPASDEMGGVANRADAGARGEPWEDHHFEHFAREQDRWRCYDKYARICMSFGVNQMLEALAYYILGVVWDHTQLAALLSVFAVKLLGMLLMSIDTYTTNGWEDCCALVFLYLLPPMLAGFFVRDAPAQIHTHLPLLTLHIVVPLIYLLKGGWLLYAWYVCMREGVNARERLRTVGYLDVLDDEQRSLASTVGAETVRCRAQRVDAARGQLQAALKEVLEQEYASSVVRSSDRKSAEIQHAVNCLQGRLEELRFTLVGQRPAEVALAKDALAAGQREVNRYEVWVKTPEILEKLEALREGAMQGWFSEEDKKSIARQYRQFLADCDRHGLGVVLPVGEGPPSFGERGEQAQPGSGSGYLLRVQGRRVPTADKSLDAVRILVHHPDTGLPDSVWLDASGALLNGQPSPLSQPNITSFSSTVNKDLRQWRKLLPTEGDVAAVPTRSFDVDGDAAGTFNTGAGSTFEGAIGRSPPEDTHCAGRHAVAMAGGSEHRDSVVSRRLRTPGCEEGQGPRDAASMPAWMPPSAIPSNLLPGRVVRLFTFGTALWWALGACWFAVTVETKGGNPKQHPDRLETLPLASPALGSFFGIQSLQCHSASIWLSTRFTMYSASHTARGGGLALEEMADMGTVDLATILCRPGPGDNASLCEVLTRNASGAWELGPLTPAAFGRGAAQGFDPTSGALLRRILPSADAPGPALGSQPVRMPLPWRLVATAWPRKGAKPLLAGWDGESVVVAQLQPEGSGWFARPQYEVDPSQGRCAANAHDGGSKRACADTGARRVLRSLLGADRRSSLAKYESVRDVELLNGGQVLAILAGDGDLDLWCLRTSELLGRWALGAEYASMCHDGERFLVAHRQLEPSGGAWEGPGIKALTLAGTGPGGVPHCGPDEFAGVPPEVSVI